MSALSRRTSDHSHNEHLGAELLVRPPNVAMVAVDLDCLREVNMRMALLYCPQFWPVLSSGQHTQLFHSGAFRPKSTH